MTNIKYLTSHLKNIHLKEIINNNEELLEKLFMVFVKNDSNTNFKKKIIESLSEYPIYKLHLMEDYSSRSQFVKLEIKIDHLEVRMNLVLDRKIKGKVEIKEISFYVDNNNFIEIYPNETSINLKNKSDLFKINIIEASMGMIYLGDEDTDAYMKKRINIKKTDVRFYKNSQNINSSNFSLIEGRSFLNDNYEAFYNKLKSGNSEIKDLVEIHVLATDFNISKDLNFLINDESLNGILQIKKVEKGKKKNILQRIIKR